MVFLKYYLKVGTSNVDNFILYNFIYICIFNTHIFMLAAIFQVEKWRKKRKKF